MYREHPLKILKNALGNIWLLIFPLLRGIKNYHLNIDALYSWIKGAWFDLLVILLIIGWGTLRWLFTWVRFDNYEVSLSSGILFKMETTIPYARISAVSSERPFYLRPFNAVRMKVNTRGGTFKSTDMNILLRTSDSKELQNKIPSSHEWHKRSFELHPKLASIIFFSFLFSSSLSGAVYISTFLFQFGSAAQDLLENELKSVMDRLTSEVSSKFALSIPPAAIFLGILIILTWLFSFISNIFRYAGFKMKRDKNFFELTMGTITERTYHIVNNKINYIDLNQSMIMRRFGMNSLNISCSGYGTSRNELPVLLPILSKKQTKRALDILDMGKMMTKPQFRANRLASLTYLGTPLIFCIGILIAARLVMKFYPNFSQLVIPFAIMAEIPAVWMIIIKTTALFITGVEIDDNHIWVRYSRFFSFHTIIADRRNVVKVQIVQNPTQKMLKRCRLDFYFSSERPKKNKLHGMNIADAEKILSILGININNNTAP